MQVFPGGNYDEKQDDSYQMTAIRETFEEAGLLLASSTSNTSPNDAATLDGSRESIHAGRTLFRDFLKRNTLSADVKALLPFTEWISPLGNPRCVRPPRSLALHLIQCPPAPPDNYPHSRFHTRFFVTFVTSSLRASGFSSGALLQRLPTPDGGQEVVETRFVHPQVALAEHRAKKIALMPPQHYILTTLADILVGREATAQQRARVERLSGGVFGRMVIFPKAGKKDANGRTALVFEGDEARGGPKGRVHRSVVLFNPETKVSLHDACTVDMR